MNWKDILSPVPRVNEAEFLTGQPGDVHERLFRVQTIRAARGIHADQPNLRGFWIRFRDGQPVTFAPGGLVVDERLTDHGAAYTPESLEFLRGRYGLPVEVYITVAAWITA